ncbi:MAG TPA: hypothetical protein C5S51_06475 [Methanosarcinaceae archaeon]|nr:hypothetical protein [Methanosarcinaceae archaeon]
MLANTHTVLFEEQYGVDIELYSTTDEIDRLVAKRNGLESLEIELMNPDMVSPRGDVFPKTSVDIDEVFTKAFME